VKCGKCLQALAEYWSIVFVYGAGDHPPTCDAKGLYAPVQTAGGYRFCADPKSGVIVPSTPKIDVSDKDTKLPCEK